MASDERDVEDEVLISLSATDVMPANVDFPERRIILTRENDVMPIGRASKVESKGYVAGKENGWFDSPVMSRRHAELVADFDTRVVMLRDTQSLHGTFLNFGTEPMPKERDHVLADGDNIQFGVSIWRDTQTFAPTAVKVGIQFGPQLPQEDNSTHFSVQVPDSDIDDDDLNEDGATPEEGPPKLLSHQSSGSLLSDPIDLTGTFAPNVQPRRSTIHDLTSDADEVDAHDITVRGIIDLTTSPPMGSPDLGTGNATTIPTTSDAPVSVLPDNGLLPAPVDVLSKLDDAGDLSDIDQQSIRLSSDEEDEEGSSDLLDSAGSDSDMSDDISDADVLDGVMDDDSAGEYYDEVDSAYDGEMEHPDVLADMDDLENIPLLPSEDEEDEEDVNDFGDEMQMADPEPTNLWFGNKNGSEELSGGQGPMAAAPTSAGITQSLTSPSSTAGNEPTSGVSYIPFSTGGVFPPSECSAFVDGPTSEYDVSQVRSTLSLPSILNPARQPSPSDAVMPKSLSNSSTAQVLGLKTGKYAFFEAREENKLAVSGKYAMLPPFHLPTFSSPSSATNNQSASPDVRYASSNGQQQTSSAVDSAAGSNLWPTSDSVHSLSGTQAFAASESAELTTVDDNDDAKNDEEDQAMGSAFAYQQNKKIGTLASPQHRRRTHVGISDIVEITRHAGPSEPSPSRKGKRKAGEISEASREELNWHRLDTATRQPTSAAVPAATPQVPISRSFQPVVPDLPQIAVAEQPAVSHTELGSRPAKRSRLGHIARSVGWAAGWAAVGSAVVLSSLIYTAPDFA